MTARPHAESSQTRTASDQSTPVSISTNPTVNPDLGTGFKAIPGVLGNPASTGVGRGGAGTVVTRLEVPG